MTWNFSTFNYVATFKSTRYDPSSAAVIVRFMQGGECTTYHPLRFVQPSSYSNYSLCSSRSKLNEARGCALLPNTDATDLLHSRFLHDFSKRVASVVACTFRRVCCTYLPHFARFHYFTAFFIIYVSMCFISELVLVKIQFMAFLLSFELKGVL
jgi:hypothetical protein